MTHALDLALGVETVSALLYIALGAWVLTLTPRRRQTTLLGAFAVFFGLNFAPYDIGLIVHLVEPATPLGDALLLIPSALAFAAAFGLAWMVPESLESRRLLAAALVLGFTLSTVSTLTFLASPLGQGVGLPVWVALPLSVVGFGFRNAVLVLLALRASPARDHEPGDVAQLALLSVAFAAFGAFVSGGSLVRAARTTATGGPADLLSLHVISLVPWVLAAGLWGWNMIRADETTVRVHRTTTLAILGFIAAGAVYFAAFPRADFGSNAMRGVTRTLGVGLLAYGILRHDLAGLDAKVEYGLSKTTVAGVFVAVFFVVSEGAQVLFADFAESEFLGILAAGALLFALAPIQRAADRLADRAVPAGGPPPGRTQRGTGTAEPDEEATYRLTVEKYLADGELTREEERHLARLATRLGLDPERSLEIREQVEDEETEGGGP